MSRVAASTKCSCSRSSSSEQHALNGNSRLRPPGLLLGASDKELTSSQDDDLEPTLVLPATAPGAAADGSLGTSFHARQAVGGHHYPVGGRHPGDGHRRGTEAHRRHVLTMVPDQHNRPVVMQLALGALAVYNLRPSDYTPVEEVNILWDLEGSLHTRAQNGVLFTHHGFPGGPSNWFSRRPLYGVSRRRLLEGLFRKLGAVTRSCFEWRLFGCLAGWRTTPQWMRSGSRTSVRPPPPWKPPRDGADDGPARGLPWTTQVVKAIIKCSGEMQNDICRKRLVGNFLEWCDTPLIRKRGSPPPMGAGCSTRSRGPSVPWCLTRIATCTSPYHTPPVTLSWPLTRMGCSAPPLTARPPWSAGSLRCALRCEASASCAPSAQWVRAASARA